MILIAESGCSVVKSQGHLGNAGLEMIRAVEAQRDSVVEAGPAVNESGRKIQQPVRLRAIGPQFATVLVGEVFYTRISQMDYHFDDLLERFCYKNQCNIIITTGSPRVPRRVNPKKPIYGSISTVD